MPGHDTNTFTEKNDGIYTEPPRVFGEFLMPPMPPSVFDQGNQRPKEQERVIAPILERFSLPFKALAEAAHRRRIKP